MEFIDTLVVHHLGEIEPNFLDDLKARLDPRILLTSGPDLPDPADYHVLVAGRPERRHLIASPRMELLIIPFAGLPDTTRLLLLEYPHIAVHNLHHNASLTAELAVALLLAAAKLIIPYDRALRRDDWSLRYQPAQAVALAGKTALILGFGHIGLRIGRLCHALGMRVLAVRRNSQQPAALDFPAEIHPLESLPELLPQAHVLLVAVPNTPQTEGLVGEAELRRMPPGGLLVNIARGPVVEQGALYRALLDGHLRAAGLDVWYHYPQSAAERSATPPADFPFHMLENVVMSPHRAGLTIETEALRMQALAELLNAACSGATLPLPNRVDVQAGY
jgi:phosphoglycerate dehydrogenase-like enzyme